jgi:hypothetical protein
MLNELVKKFPAFFGWSFTLHCRTDKELEKARELFVKVSPPPPKTTILLGVPSFDTYIHAHTHDAHKHTYI